MGVGSSAESGRFADKLAARLQQIDYRIAATRSEREAVYRLRYQCYLREGAISPNHGLRLTDDYDRMENCWVFGVYEDNELLSSIRFHIISPEHPRGPSLDVFPDVLMPMVEAGKTIIDPTRFVIDVAKARRCPSIAYMTVRIVCMAAEYFQVDYCLASVRHEHQAFYSRLFGFHEFSPPRAYPSLLTPISLMGAVRTSVRDMAAARNPVFVSSFAERRMLFDQPKSEAEISGFVPQIVAG